MMSHSQDSNFNDILAFDAKKYVSDMDHPTLQATVEFSFSGNSDSIRSQSTSNMVSSISRSRRPLFSRTELFQWTTYM